MASLGPYCDALGLTELNFMDKLSVAAQSGINNGQAYEIYKYVHGVKLPWRDIRTRFPGGNQMTDLHFLIPMCSVKTKRKQLAKTGRMNEKLADYLRQPFRHSQPGQNRKRKTPTPDCTDAPPATMPRLEAFNRDVADLTSKKFIEENRELQARNQVLEKENKELRQKLQRSEKTNAELRQQLKQLTPKS